MHICIYCGEEIDSKRLKAIPNPKICIDCQSSREKSGKFNKHHMEITQEIKGWTHESVITRIVRGDDI